MTNALPKLIAEYLDGPAGKAALEGGAIWFRWDTRMGQIMSSGNVLKSTPEQMSRPGTAVYLRIAPGGWKRYC